MTLAIRDLGAWDHYVPDTVAPTVPEGAMFCRSRRDGTDWYSIAHDPAAWAAGSIKMTLREIPEIGLVVQAVTRDAQRLFPSGMHILEVIDASIDPDEPPHRYYEKKVFDPTTEKFMDQPAAPTRSVAASQAKIALFNHGYLSQARKIIEEHPYEPVRIFYSSAQTWQIDHPYVMAIGQELGLSSEEIQSLFEHASRL